MATDHLGQTPRFDLPQHRDVTLTRPLFIKGKGLPKDGFSISEGTAIKISTDNGAEWYATVIYRGREIHVAVNPATL